MVNALHSGKNPGLVYGGRQRRETAVGQLAARATNLWGLLQMQTTMISYTYFVTRNYGRFRTMLYTELTDCAKSEKRLVKLSLPQLSMRSFKNITFACLLLRTPHTHMYIQCFGSCYSI